MTLLKTQNLTKRYMYDKHYYEIGVENISISINEGEIVAIRGRSGSGKSTLLNLLGGIDKPSGGRYYFLDHEVSKMSSSQLSLFRLHHIGFIFQDFHLMRERSVIDNVCLPLLYAGLTLEEAKEKAKVLVKAVNLSHYEDKMTKHLSGGQRQRVAVARSLANSPKMILADEPTGNLDETNSHAVFSFLKEINHLYNTTLVIATHDNISHHYANRTIHMHDGHIQEKN
ncbi:TPA: ABC transporter ATP-binding protein [Legionella pneumophila]|nr:ABC transporter ATP-binding protein [Legionella pneumophila]